MSENSDSSKKHVHASGMFRPTTHPDGGLDKIVDALCMHCYSKDSAGLRGPRKTPLPSRKAIEEIVEELRSALFPGYFGNAELSDKSMHFHVGYTLDLVLRTIKEQIYRGLCFTCTRDREVCRECDVRAVEIAHRFFERLRRCSEFWLRIFGPPTREIRLL